ncbi:SDR family oxidoreductase [Pelagibacterium sp. H642]|uniref:SDR family oxidoreductase n=1 Tax=Pelagibacterium sp. H642 TaxID=1881069 RepID=UPI002815761B|nr:SDR family oxidoreductase [Pelagibacterium sp. H642]WMT92892.1 SDR family oxidoreductase [Pelagibacterium sp. H642]
MRVLVLGATGFIGTAVCARLAQEGHIVVGAGRRKPQVQPLSVDEWVCADLSTTQMQDWLSVLDNVEVVVNCVGVLQDSPRESTRAAHVKGPGVLFAACADAGVRRVIHFSAIGVDRHQASAFSATKLEGDEALMALPLEWVILRPSVVLGPAAFGASALFRGLAALPILPAVRNAGSLQVIALEDVTEAVAFFMRSDAPAHMTVELAGPERLSMSDVVVVYRQWLGWRPAIAVQVPDWASKSMYRLGDMASALGWRPPVRTTAMLEIRHGAIGDPRPLIDVTGIEPVRLSQTLAQRPVSVQERWFARLYFLKPLLFVILAAFWMLTGIISLTTGFPIGVDLMVQARTGLLAAPGVIAGAIADISVGLAIAYRPTTFYGLWAAIALSCFYIVAGTILLPELWNEPLGPLLKIWPILAAHGVALAILEER